MATPQLDPEAVNTLLNAVTGTGVGIGYGAPISKVGGRFTAFSWQTIMAGTFTAIGVEIDGSNDGVNWTKIDASTNVSGETRAVVNFPCAFLRANVTAYTGGTSVTVLLVFGAP